MSVALRGGHQAKTGNDVDTLTVWLCNSELMDCRELDLDQFTSAEKDRIQSYKFKFLKDFYIKVHASIRKIVAKEFELDAKAVTIDKLPCPLCGSLDHGPPILSCGTLDKHFSLSKSYPFFVFCVAEYPCGIDLERKTQAGTLPLGDLVLSERELCHLRDTSAADDALKFWVRKEAVLKAEGVGIVAPLAEVDVSYEIGDGCYTVVHNDTEWCVIDLAHKGDDFELALAIPSHRAYKFKPRIKGLFENSDLLSLE